MNDSLPHDGIAMQSCPTARAALSLANAILAIALAAALQAEEPRQLNGTQAEKVMTLVRGTSPYLVTGTYDVPPESELIIEAGTKLLFAKDAALNVRGTLLIKGSESAPVELTGKATGGPTWQGLRINKSPSTQIDYARISGAKNGIYVYSSKIVVNDTVLASNIVGLYSGGDSKSTFTNCLITQNREDGVHLQGPSAVVAFNRCTISRNGGWGIRGSYYVSTSIIGSIVSDNKNGGLQFDNYTNKAEAHDSMFLRNKDYDVFNGSPEIWDFSGNWWGTSETQQLKSKGDTANLRSIGDGRDKDAVGKGEVILSNFLEREPEDCGSRLSLAPSR